MVARRLMVKGLIPSKKNQIVKTIQPKAPTKGIKLKISKIIATMGMKIIETKPILFLRFFSSAIETFFI